MEATNYGRRRFIAGAAAATVAAAGGLGSYAVLTGDRSKKVTRNLAADELGHALFDPLVGDELTIAGPSGRAAGVVAAVTPVSTYSNGHGTTGSTFSVMIESVAALDQDTYEFGHGRLGSFPMFIVPVDQPSEGPHSYQAVFNRLT